MPQDLTTYLNEAKAKLNNEAVSNRAYPLYYRVLSSTVEEWKEPENQSFATGAEGFTTKLIATHNINALPDNVAAQLKTILDLKLWKYNLYRGIVTAKP